MTLCDLICYLQLATIGLFLTLPGASVAEYSTYDNPATTRSQHVTEASHCHSRAPKITWHQQLSQRVDLCAEKGLSCPDLVEGRVEPQSNLTAEQFKELYDGVWPVILTDVIPSWACSNWTGQWLSDTYGSSEVTMKYTEGPLSAAEGFVTTLSEFHRRTQEPQTRTQEPQTSLGTQEPQTSPAWFYLEDEHFLPDRPELLAQVGSVEVLGDDLFSLLPADLRPWGALLLWGSLGSRSSLHVDPYNWTGVSAVLRGTKHWKLFPPGQDTKLDVRAIVSNFPLSYYHYQSSVDAFSDSTDLSHLSYVECQLTEGQLLIIPPGWLHQAYNAEETLAISSQAMTDGGAMIVIEELIKYGHMDYNDLPCDGHMSSYDLVKVMAKHLTESMSDKMDEA